MRKSLHTVLADKTHSIWKGHNGPSISRWRLQPIELFIASEKSARVFLLSLLMLACSTYRDLTDCLGIQKTCLGLINIYFIDDSMILKLIYTFIWMWKNSICYYFARTGAVFKVMCIRTTPNQSSQFNYWHYSCVFCCPVFQRSLLREFLLTKLINAEISCYKAQQFSRLEVKKKKKKQFFWLI